MAIFFTVLALLLLPIATGAGAGRVLSGYLGRRLTGPVAAAILFTFPSFLLVAIGVHIAALGLWDVIGEALLFSLAFTAVAHRYLPDRSGVVLALTSLLISLVGLEIGCRVLLPPAPMFPGSDSPHLWLADALFANTRNHSWGLQSKELVGAALYGEVYPGILDVSQVEDILLPHRFKPGPESRHVLHIGDSMTFGLGVERQQTFQAGLERQEPGTRHINGGIPGTAPDAYYLVLRRWLDLHRIDFAVMYLFEGNDVRGLGETYPCCEWQPLLVYGEGGPTPRCPDVPRVELSKAGGHWLLYNSPPPFLLRLLIPYSSAAAYVSAQIVSSFVLQNLIEVEETNQTQLDHVEAILRAAAGDLGKRGVPLAVVVLPSRRWIEDANSSHEATAIAERAQKAGVPTLDLSEPIRQAADQGQVVFLPNDTHFSQAGNELVAEHLHTWLTQLDGYPR